MVPHGAIRERSYRIWQEEGCPEGKACEHWSRAIVELGAEFRSSIPTGDDWRLTIMPVPRISQRPRRIISWRGQRGRNARLRMEWNDPDGVVPRLPGNRDVTGIDISVLRSRNRLLSVQAYD